MTYVGATPTTGDFKKLDSITTSSATTFNLRQGGVAVYPQSANHCIVSLNGVIQAPVDAFTIVNDTIVFASSLASSDVINFILVLGNVNDIGTPSDDTVSTAKLQANAVTTAKITDGNVTAAKFNADVISGQTELATTPADTDELLLSDAGVLKRIDYSYLKAGDNTPYFRADTTTQTVGGEATLVFTNSIFDSASGYNTSTGKYTIPSGQGGYWWFQANANIGSSYTGMYFNIKVEGTNRLRGVTSNASAGAVHCSGILNVSAGDEVTVALELGASQGLSSTAYTNAFSGFKLIT